MSQFTDITYEESLELENRVYLDVRAPVEFNNDHIPGSVNIPLFSDDERSEVGTLYRLSGRDNAVIRGSSIVGEKLDKIIAAISAHKNRNIVFVCARGGMRSRSIAALAGSLGFNAYRLGQGYREYRRYIHECMETFTFAPPLFVLQGLTGVGKTAIIESMPSGIDLEGMAGHRSSIFGGLGLVQNSQKRFESLLFMRQQELASADRAVIEGESRKVGNLHIPPSLYRQMKSSPAILITAPMQRRIEIILESYTGNSDMERVPGIVSTLSARLGRKTIDELTALFNRGDLALFVEILLTKYYDPLYRHSIGSIDFIAEITNTDTVESVSAVNDIISSRITGKI